MAFTPKTGAVVDVLRRSEPLTKVEEDLAVIAERDGFFLYFSRELYDPEIHDEPFEPFNTYTLGIEQFYNNKIYAQFIDVGGRHGPPYPEILEHYKTLVKVLLERRIEEDCGHSASQN